MQFTVYQSDMAESRPALIHARPRPAIRLWCGTTLVGGVLPAICMALAALVATGDARADEGGVSFWIPGQYAQNLIATPPSPGWSVPVSLYYYSGSAPGSAGPSSAIPSGTRSQSWQLSASPTWAPETKLLGGQFALSLSAGYGCNATQVATTGAPVMLSQTVGGATDVAPTAMLSWQVRDDSWMAYLTGNVPVGSYGSDRLSNVGIGHGALDGGGVYTYDSDATGHSFSAALGVTYNFINPDTHYRSGLDSHLGLSAMFPLTRGVRAGLSGYVYYQLTGDSGGGDACGSCKSRVAGVGPQLNWTFNVGKQSWSANVRGYWEFWASNHLQGTAWFATVAIPLGPT
jgi:hypothetical protein